jgi:hypothetical protein
MYRRERQQYSRTTTNSPRNTGIDAWSVRNEGQGSVLVVPDGRSEIVGQLLGLVVSQL